jgi:hypothetical protein
MLKASFTRLASLLLIPGTAAAAEFHVSPAGSNASPGTAAEPWRTLSHAAGTVFPGDTVIVHGGNYNERLVPARSGTAPAYICFRAAAGESPVIDGSGLVPGGFTGLVDLSSRSFIRIEGFTIGDYSSNVRDIVPVGILLQGASEGIEIVGNRIENIASTATVDDDLLGRNAHGIAVYGNAATAISNLLIRDNELLNLTLGSSEALVLNGNVTGFRVLGNHVHHCDNIGIDAIGFEGTGPSRAVDQARGGIIAGNLVHHITSASNPAYGGETSAGGIYVDGGRDIIIERNHVHHCDIGIEVASEHPDTATSNISVRSNLLVENLMSGVFIGGYDEGTTGSAENCSIVHNTFYNNDTEAAGGEYGQIHIQYRANDCTIANNILHHSIAKAGEYNVFIVQWNESGTGTAIHHNLHFGPDTPVWVLKDNWLEGWSNYLADTNSGPGELGGDPGFANPAADNFLPAAGSPAIDNAATTLPDTGDRDFPGNVRVHGSAPDRGAIERGAPAPPRPVLVPSLDPAGFRIDGTVSPGLFHELQQSTDLSSWISIPGHDSLPATSPASYSKPPPLDQAAYFRVRTR